MTAGYLKVFDPSVKIGFLAQAAKFQAALDQGQVLAPAKTIEQVAQIVGNNRLDAVLALFFMAVVVTMLIFGIRSALAALRNPEPTAVEDQAPSLATNHVTRCC
jgi:carbon starvation protein